MRWLAWLADRLVRRALRRHIRLALWHRKLWKHHLAAAKRLAAGLPDGDDE